MLKNVIELKILENCSKELINVSELLATFYLIFMQVNFLKTLKNSPGSGLKIAQKRTNYIFTNIFMLLVKF